MSFNKFGFLGLGLIGGSIARAIKQVQSDSYIVAYTPHSSTVDAAFKEKIIDKPLYEIGNEFSDCDIIFLCAPVEINNDNLEKLSPFLKEKTLITDIGSVKNQIHDKVSKLGLEKQFIGGHPMAGTERIGFGNSKASLLENAYYILTKTESTNEKQLSDYYDLVKRIGAIPLVVPFMQHDYITAAISHVPHVVSASLVNLVHDNDSKDQLMKTIAAGGFKDITRISSSSPIMWQQICTTNSANISELLSKYIDSLSEIKEAIDTHNEEKLFSFFNSAREYRESFIETSSGPIMQTFTVHVDIADKPGNLAKVASLLSDNAINIKNIGIVHNREYERGTLRIELHDQAGKNAAIKTLQDNGYLIQNS